MLVTPPTLQNKLLIYVPLHPNYDEYILQMELSVQIYLVLFAVQALVVSDKGWNQLQVRIQETNPILRLLSQYTNIMV